MSQLNHKNISLYASCSELREHALQIDAQIGKIKDISVNVSIIASQTGSKIRIFSELATQIDKSSRRMQKEMAKMLDRISDITRLAMRSVILTKRLDKFKAALQQIRDEQNYNLVHEIIIKGESENNNCIASIARKSCNLDLSLKHFEELLNRLFLALTSVRIEADLFSSAGSEANINSLSSSLENLLETLTEEYECFRNSSSNFKSLLRMRLTINQGNYREMI